MKYDEIYNIALNEIIREVSKDCAERGKLIEYVWNNYLNLFNIFKQKLVEDTEETKHQFFIENQKLYQECQNDVFQRDKKIKNLEEEITSTAFSCS